MQYNSRNYLIAIYSYLWGFTIYMLNIETTQTHVNCLVPDQTSYYDAVQSNLALDPF